MNQTECLEAATLIDRVVASLCDLLEFEEGDTTDQDLTALATVAMRLREQAITNTERK